MGKRNEESGGIFVVFPEEKRSDKFGNGWYLLHFFFFLTLDFKSIIQNLMVLDKRSVLWTSGISRNVLILWRCGRSHPPTTTRHRLLLFIICRARTTTLQLCDHIQLFFFLYKLIFLFLQKCLYASKRTKGIIIIYLF